MARTDPTLGWMIDARRDQSHLQASATRGAGERDPWCRCMGVIMPIHQAGRLRAPSATVMARFRRAGYCRWADLRQWLPDPFQQYDAGASGLGLSANLALC
jgi:hypothetical protein